MSKKKTTEAVEDIDDYNPDAINDQPIDDKQFYRGDKKLLKDGAQFEWSPKMVKENQECKDDIIYFAENHFYITNVDKGKMIIPLYVAQKQILRSLQNNRFVSLLSCRQAGKALACNTPILTENGWSTMEKLKDGDTVFGSRGQYTKVLKAHDILHNRICYAVEFDSDEVIVADAEHLWFTQSSDEKTKGIPGSVKTTLDILESGIPHCIPRDTSGINAPYLITNITLTESVPVRCITVDSEDCLYLVGRNMIPTHNTTLTTIFALWLTCFTDDQRVVIVANNENTAIRVLKRVRLAYEMLPSFLKPGLKEYGKTGITFANDSSIGVSTTTSTAARGDTANCLIIDEAAFIEQSFLKEFWKSVIPVISSGRKTKIFMVSTPNGTDNKFYEIYSGAEKGTNGWKSERIDWWDVPGRTERWKKNMIATLGSEADFEQEFGNHFVDNGEGAIASETIDRFKRDRKHPLWTSQDNSYRVFVAPNPNNLYVIGVDVGEGIGRASTVAQILDVTDLKAIEQVAVLTTNNVDPYHFANKLFALCKHWGNPPLLIERNNCGAQVIDALHYTLSYEKIASFSKLSNTGSYASTRNLGIFSHNNLRFEAISNMRYWINSLQSVMINDLDTIQEFETFIKQPNGIYRKRNDRFHDDHVMALVWGVYMMQPELCQQWFTIQEHDTQGKPSIITDNGYFDKNVNDYIVKDLDTNSIINIIKPHVDSRLNNTGEQYEERIDDDVDYLLSQGYTFL